MSALAGRLQHSFIVCAISHTPASRSVRQYGSMGNCILLGLDMPEEELIRLRQQLLEPAE